MNNQIIISFCNILVLKMRITFIYLAVLNCNA